MRKICFSLVLLLAGCCTLNEDYIRQDRKDFDTLAPRIRKMLRSTLEYTPDQQQDIEDRLQGRNARITQAEAMLETE